MFKIKYLLTFTIALLLAPLMAQAQFAFVLNSNDDSLSVIDTKTYKEVSRNRVGREPHHWADRKSVV